MAGPGRSKLVSDETVAQAVTRARQEAKASSGLDPPKLFGDLGAFHHVTFGLFLVGGLFIFHVLSRFFFFFRALVVWSLSCLQLLF